jgi:hypothetical protein
MKLRCETANNWIKWDKNEFCQKSDKYKNIKEIPPKELTNYQNDIKINTNNKVKK